MTVTTVREDLQFFVDVLAVNEVFLSLTIRMPTKYQESQISLNFLTHTKSQLQSSKNTIFCFCCRNINQFPKRRRLLKQLNKEGNLLKLLLIAAVVAAVMKMSQKRK